MPGREWPGVSFVWAMRISGKSIIRFLGPVHMIGQGQWKPTLLKIKVRGVNSGCLQSIGGKQTGNRARPFKPDEARGMRLEDKEARPAQ